MRSVLVTGGAGFIGSHACKALAGAGFRPVVYDNLVTGHADSVKWGPLVVGDIADAAVLADALDRYRPVAVMHFAAFTYVGESVSHPQKYYDNNVHGTLSLLGRCIDAGVDKLIFSSSCATYGEPDTLPMTEATPKHPISPYGRTKLMAEEILADFDRAYGLRYIALRYFNASGADPAAELAERHDPETHLVPRALMAAAGTVPALEIFGDDYPTPDGTCIRDYVHVTDLATAHVAALEDLLAGGGSAAINLGTGRGTSVREILDTILAVTGTAVPHTVVPRRPGDPPALYADASLARTRLNFAPKYSDIETIIRTAAPTFGLVVR